MNRQHTPFVRDLQAGSYLDAFLVCAVGAILSIRFYLKVTGYPQIGGESLHIAHMLWGGLLMLVALVLLISFLNRAATWVAVILGGLGFGTFIDEVGKFITKDNDYFFQPSVAIMYATFVILYLVGRLIHSRRGYTPTEYLVNALKEMEELAVESLDAEEQRRALLYLSRSDPGHPLTVALAEVLERSDLIPVSPPNPLIRLRDGVHRAYVRVVDTPVFPVALILFFSAQMLTKLGVMLSLVFSDQRLAGTVETVEMLIGAGAAVLVVLGIFKLRQSRLNAYRYFRASILIDLFIGEIFVFAREELGALTGFAFNLLILAALAYLIDQEKLRA